MTTLDVASTTRSAIASEDSLDDKRAGMRAALSRDAMVLHRAIGVAGAGRKWWLHCTYDRGAPVNGHDDLLVYPFARPQDPLSLPQTLTYPLICWTLHRPAHVDVPCLTYLGFSPPGS